MQQWWINLNKTDVRNFLAGLWVLATMGLLYILIFKAIPKENHELLYLAIGSHLTYTGVIINWYFGAAKTEADKGKSNE